MMRTVSGQGMKRAVAAAIALLMMQGGAAAQVGPFKNDLFAHPALIDSRNDGALSIFDYREMRDINGRDEVPERRAKRAYVDLGVNRQQRELRLENNGRLVDALEVGVAGGAKLVVIFVHGRGGDRRLGTDDWSFGGNFNRLKNLVARAGGTYYAPSVGSFDAAGASDVGVLIDHARRNSPSAAIIVACGSMGSVICYDLARDSVRAPHLAGLVILGGPDAGAFVSSPAHLAHGGNDRVYPWQQQAAALETLKRGDGGYPVRMALFNTGSHGTPIRMIDWHEALNWILAH
jgi:hypothetical protein